LNPVLIRRAQTPPVLQILAAVLIWMALIFSASSDSHSYEHSSRFVEPFLRWLFPHLSERMSTTFMNWSANAHI